VCVGGKAGGWVLTLGKQGAQRSATFFNPKQPQQALWRLAANPRPLLLPHLLPGARLAVPKARDLKRQDKKQAAPAHIHPPIADWAWKAAGTAAAAQNADQSVESLAQLAASLKLLGPTPLNPEQRMAVAAMLAGSGRSLPFSLFGPPGTGKSVTVVECILQIRCVSLVCVLRVVGGLIVLQTNHPSNQPSKQSSNHHQQGGASRCIPAGHRPIQLCGRPHCLRTGSSGHEEVGATAGAWVWQGGRARPVACLLVVLVCEHVVFTLGFSTHLSWGPHRAPLLIITR